MTRLRFERTKGKAPRGEVCTCGLALQRCVAEDYDATPLLGIPTTVKGPLRGLGCTECRTFHPAATAIERLTREAVESVMQLPRRLNGKEGKFLRNAGLGLGQWELARRLETSRSTVARWEAASFLPADHDYVLRAMVLGKMLGEARKGRKLAPSPKLLELTCELLGGVRKTTGARQRSRLCVAG